MTYAIRNMHALSHADFGPLVRLVSDVVKQVSGIQLGERQASMIQSRLVRRMLDLGLVEPAAYESYIRDNQHAESIVLISLLTTHHTYFFREFEQFSFLLQSGLPEITAKVRASGRNKLRIWSMACSRGQESYSLSMFLSRHLPDVMPGMGYEILGTDIDPESVAIAKNGVYRWDEVKEIPAVYLSSHWARGSGDIEGFVKAKTSIKASCRFEVGNLLDVSPKLATSDQYDLIFCRNVFIYFTDSQIEVTTRGIMSSLHPWGMLFVGISESLNGRGLSLNYLGQSVYTLKGSSVADVSAAATPANRPERSIFRSEISPAKKPDLIRVLCVDDSPTVLSLLKSILTPELGFQVVATAKNGIDAAHQAATVQFDAMTLDIHMPEQNGVEYLEAHYTPAHPAVVIVSSVSREEASLGLKTLELGASDYVEKPTASDLADRGDELRTKIRCAFLARKTQSLAGGNPVLDLTRSFQKFSRIENPDSKLRIIVGGIADLKKIVAILRQLVAPQPPTLILFECSEALLAALASQIGTGSGRTIEPLTSANAELAAHRIFVSTAGGYATLIAGRASIRRTSVLVFADVSKQSFQTVLMLPGTQVIVEDPTFGLSEEGLRRQGLAARCVPYTSFLFDSDEFLNREKG